MYCSKCGKQIPDDATFCCYCGAELSPLQPEKINSGSHEAATLSDEQTSSDNDAGAKKRTGKRTIIIFLVIVLIGIITNNIYETKITSSNVKITQLYNNELGIGLSLGMKKTSIDKSLGTPTIYYDDYLYKDTYLYTRYSDGRLISMYIEYPNDRWITRSGITNGMSTDALTDLLGDPNSIEHDDKWWYYRTGNTVTGFNVNGNQVIAIYIYDATKIKNLAT